jgi:hypothetical protein
MFLLLLLLLLLGKYYSRTLVDIAQRNFSSVFLALSEVGHVKDQLLFFL